jgi:hypothetical protein
MSYEDAAQNASPATDTGPIARPDVDALPPGGFGPATGNIITGAGTVTGASGADTVGAPPGAITEVTGRAGKRPSLAILSRPPVSTASCRSIPRAISTMFAIPARPMA